MSRNSEQMRDEEVGVGLSGGEARLMRGHWDSTKDTKDCFPIPRKLDSSS